MHAVMRCRLLRLEEVGYIGQQEPNLGSVSRAS